MTTAGRFSVKRGVNIHGWLGRPKPASGAPRPPIEADDFRFIRDHGFDHVRVPTQEVELWDDSGRKVAETWERLEAALDGCRGAGLKAVFDLHVLRTHHFNAEHKPLFTDPAAPRRFAELWEELSDALHARRTDDLAYELMNEPVADDHDDWNRVLLLPYRAIRRREPHRTIVIGGNRWSNVFALKHLRVPAGDPNILTTFHFYDPMPITHYRAGFSPTGRAYDGPVQYPGVPIPRQEFDKLPADAQAVLKGDMRHFDASVLEGEIREAVAVREATGLPVYCGEFGAISHAPEAVREAWARDLRTALEKHDIGWAAWYYRGRAAGGFALFDEDGRPTPVCRGLLELPR